SRWLWHFHTVDDSSHMPAVSEDPPSTYEVNIAESMPPHFLHLEVNDHQGHDLTLRFYLAGENCQTYLEFHHSVEGVEDQVGLIAPKWELILDRLEIALDGGDINDVCLANYSCQIAHYSDAGAAHH